MELKLKNQHKWKTPSIFLVVGFSIKPYAGALLRRLNS